MYKYYVIFSSPMQDTMVSIYASEYVACSPKTDLQKRQQKHNSLDPVASDAMYSRLHSERFERTFFKGTKIRFTP